MLPGMNELGISDWGTSLDAREGLHARMLRAEVRAMFARRTTGGR